jgi:hypothetical protein
MDVGSESEQPDSGDRRKSAFSDALKRAAVKFGVGRFLYSFPSVWVDYDPRTRRIVTPPVIPVELLPGFARLQAARTPEELRLVWESIPARPWKQALLPVKDERKGQLVRQAPPSATNPAAAGSAEGEHRARLIEEIKALCTQLKNHPMDVLRRHGWQLGIDIRGPHPLPEWTTLSEAQLRDLLFHTKQELRKATPVTATA